MFFIKLAIVVVFLGSFLVRERVAILAMKGARPEDRSAAYDAGARIGNYIIIVIDGACLIAMFFLWGS